MAEDWKSAYGRVRMELAEYEGTIVPALLGRIRELEGAVAAGCGRVDCPYKKNK